MFGIIIIETNFLPFLFIFPFTHNIFQSFVKASLRDFLLRTHHLEINQITVDR